MNAAAWLENRADAIQLDSERYSRDSDPAKYRRWVADELRDCARDLRHDLSSVVGVAAPEPVKEQT